MEWSVKVMHDIVAVIVGVGVLVEPPA
jgi:hypothetical protein